MSAHICIIARRACTYLARHKGPIATGLQLGQLVMQQLAHALPSSAQTMVRSISCYTTKGCPRNPGLLRKGPSRSKVLSDGLCLHTSHSPRACLAPGCLQPCMAQQHAAWMHGQIKGCVRRGHRLFRLRALMRPAMCSISSFHSAKRSGRLITVAAMRAPAGAHHMSKGALACSLQRLASWVPQHEVGC